MPTSDQVAGGRPAATQAGAILTIDLTAIQSNYRRLCDALSGAESAAVVKADAYGLGMTKVAPALAVAGAKRFFVAQLDEAITLRGILRTKHPDTEVFVLNGLAAGPGEDFLASGVHPVLNSLGEVYAWRTQAQNTGKALAAAIHIDTGINRLGLPEGEFDALVADPDRLNGIDLRYIVSHLACADEPAHPLNAQQLAKFQVVRQRFADAKASLANSSGIFLGSDYHFDLARPGAALYGINPTPGSANPMAQVIRLQGKILQVRDIDAPQSVGYGATHHATGPTRIATVAVGYADGYLRSLSNRGSAWIGGHKVLVVGRVSMDLITLDVTAVPRDAAHPGVYADLISPDHSVDDLSTEAGTIGYEILTSLGRRYHRIYTGA